MATKRPFSAPPGISIPSTGILNLTNLLASTASTNGALTVAGGVGIGGSISLAGRLQIYNGSNFTAFQSSASGNTVYTLPTTSPATGTSVLQSTSAGVLSWVAMTVSGAASGNTAQNVYVNNAGNANVFHPILFTPSSLSAGSAISTDTTISFNPSTEILNVSGLGITSGTASTNTTTGALVVRGGLGVTGQLSFVTASLGFTGITTNPVMSFIGATSSSPITLTVQTDNSLNWEGSSGSLFSIDNNLSSGEIFAVSDISGLPIISASAGQTVNINEFGGYTQIGNGLINSNSKTNGSLVVSGGLGVTGNASIGGTIIRNTWSLGETINTRMYDYNELSMSATTTVGITSFVRIGNINYTPKSSSSYIWIEFSANYDFNNGTTVDDFWSNITVNGTEIAAINQRFLNASGGGTRSGVLFPISGRYTNSSTSGIAITVSAKRGTADDDLRVFGSSTSGYMRIMEIGR